MAFMNSTIVARRDDIIADLGRKYHHGLRMFSLDVQRALVEARLFDELYTIAPFTKALNEALDHIAQLRIAVYEKMGLEEHQ